MSDTNYDNRNFVLQKYPEAILHETKFGEWYVYDCPKPNAKILGIAAYPQIAWLHAKKYIEQPH